MSLRRNHLKRRARCVDWLRGILFRGEAEGRNDRGRKISPERKTTLRGPGLSGKRDSSFPEERRGIDTNNAYLPQRSAGRVADTEVDRQNRTYFSVWSTASSRDRQATGPVCTWKTITGPLRQESNLEESSFHVGHLLTLRMGGTAAG